MKTLLVLCLSTLLAFGAGSTLASGSADPGATSPEEPVFVDATDILYLESFPVQANLLVSGSLPSPCHVPLWEVTPWPDRIDVHLWSVVETEGMCSTVLEPFEVSIPLGSFETASLPVILNGEEVGRVEVGAQPGAGVDSLVGAGWSFGMCMGYCSVDLVIGSDGSVVLTGTDRTRNVTLFTNSGSLASVGRERIDGAVAGLAGVPLQDVYGCPDCADGGAAYLTLSQEGVVSRHDMEFGNPPAGLAELHDLAMAIIDALVDCESNDLVLAAEDCQAWEAAA